jgi:alanine racemase
MRFLHSLRQLRKRFDHPDNHLLRIELNSNALLYNIQQFKKLCSQHRFAAVLKANAYGHGLEEIGSFLDKNTDISYFVIDNIIEARLLRDKGIRKPLIILGYIPKNLLLSLKKLQDITLIINSTAQAEILKRTISFPLSVNLKVDTGMHRQGIPISEFESVIKILRQNPRLKINGLATHLADADGLEEEPTLKQLGLWQEAVGIFKKYLGNNGLIHSAATAGTSYLDRAENNLVRLGIGLYGFDPVKKRKLNLKPVLSYFAKIVNIKKVQKGQGIGYNFTFRAEHDMIIAVLPCGYYEGVPRSLSNRGYAYLQRNSWQEKTIPLPIIGRVSMNLTTIDITKVAERLKLEDEIEVFSADSSKLNSIEKVAELCETIPYEILVRLPPIIRRYVV